MKIYLVWAYDQYYPMGPNDLKGVFANEMAADLLEQELLDSKGYDFVKVTTETVGEDL